jgi:hypothetical protein
MSDQEPPAPQSLRIGDVEISGAEQTPLVLLLLSVIQQLKKENQDLRDEIQRLKGTTRRPVIKPSVLLKPPKPTPTKPPGKRPGSTKRDKTKDLRIDQDHVLQPSDLPPGAVLEGYRPARKGDGGSFAGVNDDGPANEDRGDRHRRRRQR